MKVRVPVEWEEEQKGLPEDQKKASGQKRETRISVETEIVFLKTVESLEQVRPHRHWGINE